MKRLSFIRKKNVTLIVFPLQISVVGLASDFTKKIQAGFKNYHLSPLSLSKPSVFTCPYHLTCSVHKLSMFLFKINPPTALWITSTIANSETLFLLFIVSFLSVCRHAYMVKG